MSHPFSLLGPAINLSLLQTLTFGLLRLTVHRAHKFALGNTETLPSVCTAHLCRTARLVLCVYDDSKTKDTTAVDGTETAQLFPPGRSQGRIHSTLSLVAPP